MQLKELETPALVLDLDIFDENIQIMNQLLEGSKAKLRPHYKTHKSVDIAKIQIEHGAKGITCAKLGEAEDLVEFGFKDILIANEVVQPSKIARLAFLAKKSRLTVCVDNSENIKALSLAAKEAGSTIYCYVEYNVGLNRCGVSSFEDFFALAKQVNEAEGLIFNGIQAYAGHLSHEEDIPLRNRTVLEVENTLKALKKYVEDRGISITEISGASSATTALKAKGGVYTELQAGSYIFMDNAFSHVGLPFKNALTIQTTVVSKNADSITVDAGAKSFSMDQVYPKVIELPDNEVMLSEEHFTIFGKNLPYKVGDTITFIPGHCCTTVNLFDCIYLKKGEEIVGKTWVQSRGKAL